MNMEDNLKCGEIIYVNNQLQYLCCLCDNYENHAQQFEEHIYAVHLSYIKAEELELPLSPKNETTYELLELDDDCDKKIKDINVIKKEMIFDDDSITKTKIRQLEYDNQSPPTEETISNIENDNFIENLLTSSNLTPSSSPLTIPPSSPQPAESATKIPATSRTICNHCKKDFFQYKILRSHNRIKQLSCSICMDNFCGIKMLDKHIATDHPDSIPPRIKPKRKAKIVYHYCDICSGTFKSYQNLKRHMIIHSGKKPYACQLCDSKFASASGLLTHKRTHHQDERPFLCNECGKSFKMLMVLNLHIRTIHQIQQPHPCPLCPQVLGRRKSLLAHIKGHTTDTSCKCKECGKILKSLKCLRQHEKIHLETKLYKCTYCDMRFAQAAGRRGHIRHMHE